MPGAQLQLNSIHGNDSFLTENPQMSLFNKMYHSYNNYARLTYNLIPKHETKKNISHPNKYSLILPKNGDLIKGFFISIKLPQITLKPNKRVRWIDNVAHKIIKKVTFKIGALKVQEFDSEYLYLHYERLLTKGKKNVFDYLTNKKLIHSFNQTEICFIKGQDLIQDLSGGTSLNIIPEIPLTIPIPVWFADDAFPISALEFDELKVEIETSPLHELLLCTSNSNDWTSDIKDYRLP